MLKAILFDLDGTLLPMDQDVFLHHYMGGLAARMEPRGYDRQRFVKAVWAGTGAMINNDGAKTNEEVFWDCFCRLLGPQIRQEEPVFLDFYRNEFQNVQAVCGRDDRASQVIRSVKEKGLTAILATNPLFPAVATHSRVRWAGLEPGDFALITTYENSSHCKPNPDYYRDILARFCLQPEECVMVGNDVDEDMLAQSLGMQVFLLTDCLINQGGKDISGYPQGSFDELLLFIDALK